MKKVLFTTALFLTACAVSAQESVVKEAKSAKSDPVKAAQIIEPALVDPSTANDPETWKLAGDFQKAIYDEEGNSVESAPHPQQKLAVDLGADIEKYDLLRRSEA